MAEGFLKIFLGISPILLALFGVYFYDMYLDYREEHKHKL